MLYRLISLVLISFIFVSGCSSTRYQESTGQFVDSSAITLRVKTDLAMDSDIKSLNITVTTYKDNVVLSGNVYSSYQRDKALSIASHVSGVRSVTNHLVIKQYH